MRNYSNNVEISNSYELHNRTSISLSGYSKEEVKKISAGMDWLFNKYDYANKLYSVDQREYKKESFGSALKRALKVNLLGESAVFISPIIISLAASALGTIIWRRILKKV
jgi:hypothetical protein